MTEPITDLPAAVAALGALPMPAGSPRPISDLDVPLPTLRDRMAALVERQKQEAAAERLRLLLAEQSDSRPATPGEIKEQRHWLHDADPDSTVPAIRVDLTKHKPEETS